MKLFWRILFSFFCTYSIWAMDFLAPSTSLFVVDEIRVEGNRKVEKEAILQKVATRVGHMVDNQQIYHDVEQIYGLKFFDQVQVDHLEEKGKNILVYIVQERPIVKKVVFEGNKDQNREDLIDKVKSKEFSILDISTIQNDMNALQKHYEDKGFFLAAVSYELRPIDKENVELVFHVREFDKVKVKKITFLGNRALADQELKDVMETREESIISFMTNSGNFKELSFKTDVERIKYFYKTKGYLQVNVGQPEVTVSEDRRWIFITMKVTEGPQFSINDIQFEGELLFTPSEMREEMQLKKESVYSEELLRFDIQKLTEMYQDKGYAFANVMRTLKIVPGENKVDIQFGFEKGKLAHIGTITMRGNSRSRDKVIRRELTISEGMLFNGTAMRVSKENVIRLGFFEPTGVIFNTVAREGHDDILDVEILVKEKDTGQFVFGAGFATSTGGFIQASVSKMNFLGYGQELNLTVNYAKKSEEYSFGFTEPYLLDTKWTAGGRIFYSTDRNDEVFSERNKGFEYRTGYPIFDYTRFFVVYRLKHTHIYNNRDPLTDVTLENGYTSAVETYTELDKRNNRNDVTDGHYLRTSVEYAGLGGDHFWATPLIDGRYYNNFYGDFVFRTRLVAAKIFETNPSRPVPTTNKFFLGGAKDMRGYYYNTIGPMEWRQVKGDDGKLEWKQVNMRGLFKTFANFELEHPILKEGGLKWVVFFDVGNVYKNTIGENKNYTLRTDWGVGIRFLSPLGPLRFELGFPISRRAMEAPNSFNFDIGPSF